MEFEDGRRVPQGAELRCDVCIVGAGAAGITLALELADSPLSVILLEAGDRRADAATQQLYDGEVADPATHSSPRYYRKRQFGGTTTVWGGGCVPYEPIDFERRDWVPHSGWPIGWEEVARHYPRAAQLLEVGSPVFRAGEALPDAPRELIPGFRSERVRDDWLERNSRPTDFGARYAEQLRAAPRLRVLLNSNCVNLAAAADGAAISEAEVATLAGNRFRVAARRFVIATGGLETPRLLLASRDVSPRGIGNDHDQVGRCYMRHLTGSVGVLELNGPRRTLDYGISRSPEGVYCRRLLAIDPAEQRRLHIGGVIFRLWSVVGDPAHRSGGLSAQFLAQGLLPYERKKWARSAPDGSTRLGPHLRNIARDPGGAATFAYNVLSRRLVSSRQYPTVMVNPRVNRYTLNFVSEQVPLPESRVGLSTRRDALGMPRLHIDWRYAELDVRSVQQAYRVVAEELGRSGAGRLSVSDEEVESSIRRNGAFDAHHIGTTRMSDDPTQGVVDRDCRVHGVANLYVASAAVFPTSSHALPTLTIVAMAVRLAEHLRAATAPRPLEVAVPM